MSLLLRLIAPIAVITCVLVLASIAIGAMSDSVIVTGNMEIESQVYIIYIENAARGLRVRLEGTGCFETRPHWMYGKQDADLLHPPVPDYGRFFTENVNAVMDVLDRCRL